MIKLTKKRKPGKGIIDNSKNILVETIPFYENGTIETMQVSMDLEHPSIGDLVIKMRNPEGLEVLLHNRIASESPTLKTVYDQETLASFIGNNLRGNWTLIIEDQVANHEGILYSWSIGLDYFDSVEEVSASLAVEETVIPDAAATEEAEVEIAAEEAETAAEEAETAAEEAETAAEEAETAAEEAETAAKEAEVAVEVAAVATGNAAVVAMEIAAEAAEAAEVAAEKAEEAAEVAEATLEVAEEAAEEAEEAAAEAAEAVEEATEAAGQAAIAAEVAVEEAEAATEAAEESGLVSAGVAAAIATEAAQAAQASAVLAVDSVEEATEAAEEAAIAVDLANEAVEETAIAAEIAEEAADAAEISEEIAETAEEITEKATAISIANLPSESNEDSSFEKLRREVIEGKSSIVAIENHHLMAILGGNNVSLGKIQGKLDDKGNLLINLIKEKE